jgi:hypothetical protein
MVILQRQNPNVFAASGCEVHLCPATGGARSAHAAIIVRGMLTVTPDFQYLFLPRRRRAEYCRGGARPEAVGVRPAQRTVA